jgi:hypothetical protein
MDRLATFREHWTRYRASLRFSTRVRPQFIRCAIAAAITALGSGWTVQAAAAQAATCPRPALARLAMLVGDWAVAWDWRVGDSLLTVAGAHATVTRATAGCTLVERLEGRLRGAAIEVTSVIAAPTTDSLQLAYVDSEHGALLNFEGSARGDTIRFTWSRDAGQRRLIVRREYSGIGPHHFEVQALMSPDGGRNWILVHRARYERRR